MMWKDIYDSPLHHPLACWVATVALLVWDGSANRLLPRQRVWLWLFGLSIVADAWLTGGWSPVPVDHPASQPVAIGFVIAGDWRFFVWAGLLAAGRPAWQAWLMGLGWALIVPVGHGLAIRMLPNAFADLRVVYLVYELAMVGVVALWWRGYRRRLLGGADDAAVRAFDAIARFELVQYAGWAAADVVILGGLDSGHGLRLLPNLMYYAGFLAFAVASARPRDVSTPPDRTAVV